LRTLYGPVISWRFGRSLGIDPLASRTKLCPLSCVYCQYGPTTRPSITRRTYVTAERLRNEAQALGFVEADAVTFAGLGEPTLAANLTELADVARAQFGLPVIVLTGSGLMPRTDVQRDLLAFDTVVAKLDAADQDLFRRVNRPCAALWHSFAAIVEGIRSFRQVYRGKFVLQMMFVQANLHAADDMAALARDIAPNEVQLNTPLQPALGGPLSATQMALVQEAFAGLPVCNVYADGAARVRPRLF